MKNTTGEKTEAVKDSSNQMKIENDKRTIEIGTEFCRLMEIGNYYPLKKKRFDFGNGYLYLFCQEHPLPETIIEPDLENSDCSGDSDMLTEQEAAFADQLWLIGRSYAASPERYSYPSKKDEKPKPSDKWLGDEGYESFFGDIARTLFRKECHDPDNPVVYLRGIKEKLKTDEIFDKNHQNKDKAIANLRNSFITLDGFASFLRDINDLKKKSHFLFFDKNQTYEQNEIKILDDDLLTIKQVTDLVIRFAQLLNAARFVRDAAIIHKALKLETAEILEEGAHDPLYECRNLFGVSNPSSIVSFSSKFLHFHVPQFFFIYDSIASKNIGTGSDIHLELNSASEYRNEHSQSNEANIIKINIKNDCVKERAFIKKISESINVLNTEQSPNDKRCVNTAKANSDSKFRIQNDPESTNSSHYNNYLILATKELALAYVVFNYLLEQKAGDKKDIYNQIIASLKRGTCNQNSDSNILKPPYYSITRMIDLLVSNTNKGTNNTKGKGKNNNKENSGSNVQSQ